VSTLVRIVLLTALWVLLWGDVSVANIASGVALSTVLLVLYPVIVRAPDGFRRPRPLALARLGAFVLGQIVVSNAQLSRQILSRRPNVRTGVVACHLDTTSPRTITFLANVLTLGPGTIPVLVTSDPAIIYLHVLRADDPDATRRQVARLEALTARAFER
jgi:multicomponent Na+:H+ antiporter subunit E